MHVCATLSGTYTIDGGTATGGTNYNTFTEAVAALLPCGISGPVIFEVADGTYTEQITIPAINGASSTNTITFKSASANSTVVILDHPSSTSSTNNFTVLLDGAEYIIFNQITIQRSGTNSYGRVVEFDNGASNNQILNNRIISSVTTSTGAAGIYSYNTKEINNTISGNQITNGYYGIYWYGVSGDDETGNIIQSNTITDFYYYGIYTYYQNGLQITGNTIENLSTSSTAYGIYAYYADEVVITKNQIHVQATSSGYGMYLYYCDGTAGSEGLVANNFVSQIVGAVTAYGIETYYSDYIKLYNNNINITGATTSGRSVYVYYGTAVEIANNILVNTGGGYCLYTSSTTSITSCDYNDFYFTGSYLGYYSLARADLAAWQTATSDDANSVSMDPQFVSSTNLHVQEVNLIGQGTNIAVITDDIDGDSRANPPCIGADEFIIPGDDAGVISIDGPAASPAPTPPGVTNIDVTIKNYGVANLTACDIEWSVDGTPQTAYNWTGNIAQNVTDGSITIGTYNFSVGDYQLKIWTANPNGGADDNNWNDTLEITVNVCNTLSGTYTIDGGTATGGTNYNTFTEAVAALLPCGISGPVIFEVADGTYVEQITIPSISGASGTNTITFRSASADNTAVTLSHPSSTSSTNNFTILLDGAEFIIFNQMTIERSGSNSYARVIEFKNGASYDQIVNNRIFSTETTSTSAAGIYSYNTNESNNYIAGNEITNGYYGIYWYGVSGSDETGNIILSNTITNFYYYGIYTYYQNGIQISDNVIENSLSSSTAYGIYANYADELVITKNDIHVQATSSNYGMYLYYCDGTAGSEGLVANNFVNQSVGSSTAYGIETYYSDYMKLYNNSINIAGVTTSGRALYVYYGTDIEVINNVLSNTGGGYCLYTSSTTSITSCDYNDFYFTGSYLGYYSGNMADLAAWQTATSDDANSVSVDPGFLSATDLHSNSFSINGLATPIGVITDDIDGDARTASPDIGADEFDPPDNDAGIIAITNPVTPAPVGSNNIEVTVQNFGNLNLTSCTINWSVDGIPGTPYNWTGNEATAGTDGPVTVGSASLGFGYHTIRAWTTNPNGTTDGNNINDTTEIVIYACSIMSGTFTIGGVLPDFDSFNEAVDAMISCGIDGPVIFNVRTGTYAEQVVIPSITGASATNTITFQSETGVNTNVVLEHPSQTTSTDNYCLQLNDADFITIKQITIQRTGTNNYARVIEFINGADDNVIMNNIIISTIGSSTYAVGIYSYTTIDNNNVISGNTITNGYYGIYWYGSGTSSLETGNMIKNNTITGFYNSGMYIYYQDGLKIDGNTIRNRSGVSTAYGMDVNYCDNNFEITKNDIYLNATSSNYCMYVYYCDGTNPNRGLVANNFVSQSTGTSTTYGIYSYYSNYVNYYNNNINITGTYSTSRALYLYYGGNLRMANNVLVNTGGGMCAYVTPTSCLVATDYNDFYWTGSNLGYYGANMANLGAWQTATSDGANSINVDPGYYSATDLHVTAFALDNAGLNLAVITDDIDYEGRSNPPDIGADEFILPPDDAGVVSINNPPTPAPTGVNNIEVTIRNFGSNNLTACSIEWELDGVPGTTYNWTGNIATAVTDGPIVIGSASLSYGWHTITAWTINPNGVADGNNYNDTCEISVYACDVLNGTYTLGGATPDFSSFSHAIDAMLNCGINGPVIFDVRDGSYTEQLRIPEIPGASAVNTVTFRSESGDNTAVVLDHPSSASSTNNWGVRLDSADYIRFHQITISRSGSNSYARVIEFINEATYNEITQCIISSSTSTSTSSVGIYSYTTLDDNNLISNNTIKNGYYGIYWYGESTSVLGSGNVFENNTLTNFYYYGIYAYYQDAITIEGNILTNRASSSTIYGIYLYYCDNSIQVNKNMIYLNGSSTTYCLSLNYCDGTAGSIGMVSNNFVSQSVGTTTTYGIRSYYTNYVDFAHNNVNITGTYTSNYGLYLYYGGNLRSYNNIFVNTGGGYCIYVTPTSTLTNSDYNDFYCTGTSLGYYSASRANLTAWQAATSMDANSLSVDPGYYSVSNLHVNEGSLDDAGLYIASITDDIDADIRANPPCIGADEFACAAPPVPTANGVSTCPDSVTLVATGSTGMYEWYDAPSGGTLLETGSTYTTPYLSSTTTYYVQAIACYTFASTRVAVTVTVTAPPATPSASAWPSSIHSGDDSDLSASVPGSTIYWYTGSCDGSLVGTGDALTVSPLYTVSYYAAAYNGSCFSPCDTVLVHVAQPCMIDAWGNGTTDTVNICPGDPVTLTSDGNCDYLMFNDFNDGSTGVGWSSNATPMFSNPCGAGLDASIHLWIGSATSFPRELITQPYIVSDQCDICFEMRYAVQTGSSGTDCEGPDLPGEGVHLQYSTDGGVTWTDIIYYDPNGGYDPTLTSWTQYCEGIPTAAAGMNTQFRWFQDVTSGYDFDHWGLDNVEISCPTSGQNFEWSHGPTVNNPPATVSPAVSTMYYVILDDGLGWGNTDTAFVYVNVSGVPTASDSTDCLPGIFTLTASGGTDFEWWDAPTGGNSLGTGASYTTPSISATTSYWVEFSLNNLGTEIYTFDSDMEGWTATTPCVNTAYNWSWNTDGGNGALFAVDPSPASEQVVTSPVLDVSTNTGTVTLEYNHKYSTEDCCDEGIVAYRLDGGSWVYFTPATGSYNDGNSVGNNPINSCVSSTLNSYHGSFLTYATHSGTIDVSSANQLEIAFVFTSDGSVAGTGWYIDEVSIDGVVGGAGACPNSRLEVQAIIEDLASDTVVASVSCYGNNDGLATATAVDGSGTPLAGTFTYSWSNSSTNDTITGLAEGTYGVTITDANGCSAVSSAVVDGPPVPSQIVGNTATSGTCNIVSPNNWVHIPNSLDNTELIASVFDATGGNDLLLTEAEATIFGSVQYVSGMPYLQRVVRVTPNSSGPATVRIYFNNAEYAALQAADPTITSINDLVVTKCDDSGSWINCALLTPSTFAVSPIGVGYYAEVSVTSFSKFYIHKNNGIPLPVELISFNASCFYGNTIVEWQTSSEINNKLFVLERSYDLIQFSEVGSIEGAGFANNINSYELYDYDNEEGLDTYYRLKQIDFDGGVKYSEVCKLKCKDEQNTKISIRPNPSDGFISIMTYNNIHKRIIITDSNGRIVFETKSSASVIMTDLSDRAAGVYFVKVLSSNDLQIERIIITR